MGCPHKRPGDNAFVFGTACNCGMHFYAQDRVEMALEVLGMDAAADPPDASYSAATFGVALGPVKADPAIPKRACVTTRYAILAIIPGAPNDPAATAGLRERYGVDVVTGRPSTRRLCAASRRRCACS